MQPDEIRLRIVEAVLPQATRVGLERGEVINTCTQLENFVLGLRNGEELPDSPPRKKQTRPAKGTEVALPSFLDPTHGG